MVTLQYWSGSKVLTINFYKNESYQNDYHVVNNVNSLEYDPKYQVSQIYLLPWSGANNYKFDFVVPFIISSESNYILRGAIDTRNVSLIKNDNISLQDSPNTIDYYAQSGRLYKNTFYLFGNDWTSDTCKRNRLLRFKADTYPMNQSSFNYRNGSNDSSLTQMFETTNILSDSNFKQIGVFPEYTSSNNSYDQNINIISLNSSDWSNRNSIVVFKSDGSLAYETKALSNNIITLTGLESTYAKSATAKQIKDKLTTDLVKTVATQFREDSTFSVSLGTPTEIQNAAGILPVTITISNGYSGNSISTSSQTIKNIEIHGFKKMNTTQSSKTNFTLDELSGGSQYKSLTINDLSINELEKLVVNNIDKFFDDIPSGVTTDDIIIWNGHKNDSFGAQSDGTITFNIRLGKRYQNGNLITDLNSNFINTTNRIQISGFIPTPPTTKIDLNKTTTDLSLNSNNSASAELSNAKTKLKEYVQSQSSTISIPKNTIITIDGTASDANGTIIGNVILNQYYDDYGWLVTRNFEMPFTITGFSTKITTWKGTSSLDIRIETDSGTIKYLKADEVS